jgi:branched-chain amino acid transport system substrate-binding protein
VHYVNNVGASIGAVLVPAGLEKSIGLISTAYLKDPLDSAWKDDKGMKDWYAFMAKYYPDGDLKDGGNVFGYAAAQTLVQVLKQCGDNLTRENVMKQAASLKDLQLAILLPGIKINTSPTDFAPIQAEQLIRFDGKQWVRFGEVIGK